MSKFTHSPVLFAEEDGTPMTFSMRIFGENNLRDIIDHGGGILQGTDGPGVLRLVDPKSKVINVSSSTTMISFQFIYDCVKANRLLDINAYTIKLNELDTSDISDDDRSSSDLRKSNIYLSKSKKNGNRIHSSSSDAHIKGNKNITNKVSSKTSSIETENQIQRLVAKKVSPRVAKKSTQNLSQSIHPTSTYAPHMPVPMPSQRNVLKPNIVKLVPHTEITPNSSSQTTAKQTPVYTSHSVNLQCDDALKGIHKNVAVNDRNLLIKPFHVSNCLKETVTKSMINSLPTVPKVVSNTLRQPQVENSPMNSLQFIKEKASGASGSSVNSSNFSRKDSLQPNKSANVESMKPLTSMQLSAPHNKVVRLYENYKQNSLVLPDSLELTIPESSQGSCACNEPSMGVDAESSGPFCYTWQSNSEFEPERIRTASLEVNVASTQNTLEDLDEFDSHLLSRLQQSEVNKETFMDQECMSQSYTISSSADPVPSQQNVSTNDSPEIFSDELPDSATQEDVLEKNIPKEDQSLLVSEAVEIVQKLREAALLCKTSDRLSSHKIQRGIKKINKLIYEPSMAMEAEKVLKKKFLSFEDKCTLVKYMCSVRKEQPEKFLEKLCSSSR